MALTIEKRPYSSGLDEVKVTGFNEGELNELKSMDHREAMNKVIEMLDSRNYGIGSTWAQGYGIYGLWFDNEAAYLNIGHSCD